MVTESRTMTEADIRRLFAQYGLDPNVHFDGTPRTGGAAGLVGKYTEVQLRNILSTQLDDYTDDQDTRFFGLPGEPELWQDGDTWYAVYYIPGSNIPQLWEVAGKTDLQSFFGDGPPVADRQVTLDIIRRAGGVVFGSTDNIPATEGDPWAGFLQRMDRAATTQPWLNDPDVFELYAAAWLEDREVEQWELEGTNWWQTHTAAERDAMWLTIRDPEEAAVQLEDRRTDIAGSFLRLGMTGLDEVVDYIAGKMQSGEWSGSYADTQIAALSGGANSAYALDSGLAGLVDRTGGIETSTLQTQKVRDEYNRWLGPLFGKASDSEVNRWATKIREQGAVAEEDLTRHLQQMRMAVLPEYTDPSMSYAEISQPWLNFGTQIWGQQLDETSGLFIELLRANDSVEAGKLLRREGLAQDINKVEQDLRVDALGREGSLRRAAN